VVGDLFQNYATKYVGIGRGIPLSNTNQLWGLAWGALVFGELTGKGGAAQALIISGSLLMIAGAVAISSAVAPEGERASQAEAILRECKRYGLSIERATAAQLGQDQLAEELPARRWWDVLIVAAAVGIFVWIGIGTKWPSIAMNLPWGGLLLAGALLLLFGSGWLLWKKTRFS
jgi:hypothetical protein